MEMDAFFRRIVVFQHIGRNGSFSVPLFQGMDSTDILVYNSIMNFEIIGEDGVKLLGGILYTPIPPLSTPLLDSGT